jgi:hypothetical protein
MRYTTRDIIQTPTGTKYLKLKRYPNIPLSEDDIYVITTIGDRLDLLAYSYYRNPEYWWIISSANNNINKGSMFLTPGTQLRIPTDLGAVLKLFNDLNYK